MKKTLAFGIVLLFIGVAFAPSLYADVETIYEQNGLVELAVEFYGLDKYNSHEVTVTREDSDKLDSIFDGVRNELNNATTNSERISIFNDCIVELDKFGLLGENSIENVKRITTDLYKEQIDAILEDADINYNCTIIGHTTGNWFFSNNSDFTIFLIWLTNIFFDILKNKKLAELIGLFLYPVFLYTFYFPLGPFLRNADISFGGKYRDEYNNFRYFESTGWVWTSGKKGVVEFEGGTGKLGTYNPNEFFFKYREWYIGAKNFNGLRLRKVFKDDNFYIGFASEVSIG